MKTLAHSSFTSALLGSALLLVLGRVRAAPHPVCIIGAGPSGLTAAHEIESRGVPTVIFDSNAEVGGKCQSYYDDPVHRTTYHAMGAIIFTNLSYSNTLPLILEAGLPLSPALSPGPSANWTYWNFSPGAGGAQNVTPQPVPDAGEIAAIEVEVEKYTQWWNTEFQPRYMGSRYLYGVPPALSVPMSNWLVNNGFELLPSFVEEGLVNAGYSDYTQTPAVYALQLLTPEILSYYIGTTPGYFVDFHKLWVWYAETHVNGPIHTSTNVTKIDRSGENPVVTYESAGSAPNRIQTCSSLVLAFPPTLSGLTAAGLDFTATEQSLFANIEVSAYWATAFNMSELPYPYAFVKEPPTPDYGPLVVLRYFEESPIATAYSYGPTPYNESTSDSDAQVLQLLIQAANDLGRGIADNSVGGTTTAITLTQDDIKLSTRRDYFHRGQSPCHLNSSFYEKYNELQGKKNTFWTSGLNRFENVESVILAAKDLVENVMF
ncbi:FAD/NAD-P-binding domain-containing protein [Lentinula raphanica]|nr:FAD/NAD-P-binding domain-containing protein [Lentinula raphanica]